MKKMLAAAFIVGAVMATTVSVSADETKKPAPIVVKDMITVTATIEAIDKTNREVILKGPKGNLTTLVVDDAVTRFDSLKVGDKVRADYYESVAYEVQPPGAVVAPDSVTAGGGKITGDKPGGGVVKQTVTTVTVTAIDMETPAVTIRTSDGSIQSFRVRHRENLTKVKVGDKVLVTQTSALMVSVAPAQ